MVSRISKKQLKGIKGKERKKEDDDANMEIKCSENSENLVKYVATCFLL